MGKQTAVAGQICQLQGVRQKRKSHDLTGVAILRFFMRDERVINAAGGINALEAWFDELEYFLNNMQK